MPPLDVLYEDNHLLVVNKRPLLPTQGALPGEESLVTQAKDHLKHQYAKPGNVYLGVVSRLDAAVSGVVVLARTSKAAARLAEQFRLGSVVKIYWAAVAGTPQPPGGSLTDFLAHNEAEYRTRVVPPAFLGAKESRLRYQTVGSWRQGAVLEIQLDTGRKHQIRVQFAARGHPIAGDRKYDSPHAFAPGIALHARRLAFEHPTRRESLSFEAPLPVSWQALGITGLRAREEGPA